jgi:processive 1,2-diacylglycerol beta-glucosyltransferase
MKILVISASVGGGHNAAAAAVELYVKKHRVKDKVVVIDGLTTVSRFLSNFIIWSYKLIIKWFPSLFGVMYRVTNKKRNMGKFVFNFFFMMSKGLLPEIKAYNPDVVICTHPFVMEMVSALNKSKETNIPLITILTDYAPHQTWISDEVNAYITAHSGMVKPMVAMGAKEDVIHSFGIPVADVFFMDKNITKLKDELMLKQGIKTITLMAGSFGVKDVFKVYNDILSVDIDFQIIVITGKNKKLYNKFKNKIDKMKNKKLDDKNTKLIMFTKEVYKYMAVSDLLITKPGGLTVSESIASNLPIGVFKPIPGQEEENEEFLVKNGMGISIKEDSTRIEKFRKLLMDDLKISLMKESCNKFDKSKSCENILKLAEQLVKNKEK